MTKASGAWFPLFRTKTFELNWMGLVSKNAIEEVILWSSSHPKKLFNSMIITPFAGFWSIHDFQNLISRDEELQIVAWDLPPREDWGIPERSIHLTTTPTNSRFLTKESKVRKQLRMNLSHFSSCSSLSVFFFFYKSPQADTLPYCVK